MIGWKDLSPRARERAKMAVRVAGEVASVAVELQGRVTPVGVVSVLAKAAGAALHEVERSSPIKGWTKVKLPLGFPQSTFDLARANKLLDSTESRHFTYWLGSIHGVRIAWESTSDWNDGPYSPTPEQAAAALRILTWEKSRRLRYVADEDGAELQDDAVGEALPSRTASQLWDQVRPLLAAGVPQPLLLVGEAGVGKSTVARQLADLAGGHSLRIRSADLHSLASIAPLISWLSPDVVLLDDIDRANRPAGVIDVVDEIMSAARMLIATANRIDWLDGAAFSRFSIRTLTADPEIVERMLDGLDGDVAETLRGVPLRYLARFRDELRAVGTDYAMDLARVAVEQHRITEQIINLKPGPTKEEIDG